MPFSSVPAPVRLLALAALVLSAACQERTPRPGAETSGAAPVAPAAPVTRHVGTVRDLQNPESARWDPELGLWFVSNVNGPPAAKDNNGYISRIGPDGTADSLKFVAGGRDKVALDAPKGMAIVGDTLWVADIDAVRGFNRKTGAAVASIRVPGALFLNDAAAGPDGVYFTDTGVRFGADGSSTHPGPDRVFRLAGRKVTVVLTFPGHPGPNGITWDSAAGRYVVVPFADSTIVTWAPGDSVAAPFATGPGMMDGVEPLGGERYLVTAWADSSLDIIEKGKVTRLAGGLPGPADIGFDRASGRVAVPLLTENRMELFELGTTGQ